MSDLFRRFLSARELEAMSPHLSKQDREILQRVRRRQKYRAARRRRAKKDR
jgi:hypothetical protein